MIDDLVRRILAVERDHPVRAGIDGPSAAGKTTLADTLAVALRAATGRTVIRAELDHFMRMDPGPYTSAERYYSGAWDLAAIHRELLGPLGPRGDRRYRTALTDAAGTPTRDLPVHTAPADAILVADGVFLQRPELAEHWDLRIYLPADAAGSLRRAVARDAAWMGGAAEAERRFRATYLPAERRYRAEVRPRERADIVLGVHRFG